MRKKSSQGLTIAEVLVFSMVGLMLMVLLTQLFITATRRTEDSRLKVDLQQKAVLVLREISQDLARASSRGMTATVSGDADYILALTPIDKRNPGFWSSVGQLFYVYRRAEKELHWREVPAGEFADDLLIGRPYVPSASELINLSTNSSGKQRILSSFVEEFSLSDRNGSKIQFQAQPLVLDLKLRRPLSHSDRFTEFTVQRRFSLRNNY